MKRDSARRPLVILGMDVGDAEAISRWTGEGHLPTIASIMQRGCWGTTGGPEMIAEYGASLSLFSGISRRRHGYYYLRRLKPGSYEMHEVKPGDVQPPVFWSRLRDRRVLIVDVPDVNTVAGLPGLQVANWATHHGSVQTPEIEPPELLETVRRAFGPQMTIHGNPNVNADTRREMLRRLLERVERKGRLVRTLLEQDRFDLTAAFFSETDAGSHYCWKYRPEAAGSEQDSEQPELRHGILKLYQAIDKQMGQVLESIGDDANVVIVSLYGMRDEYPTSTLTESFCQKLGYHVLRGEPVSGEKSSERSSSRSRIRLDPVAVARKLIPDSLRAAISRHLPRSTQERLLSSMLRDGTDWSRTTAFAIPSISTGFIRVNLQGREPNGVIQSRADYDDLLDRIEADLRELRDPQTDRPAIRRVARAVDLFGGDPPDLLPDLFIEWEPGPRFLDRVVHPRAELIQPVPTHFFDSQEKLEGFVAAAGPDIQSSGNIGEIDLLDLAPTMLCLMGEDVAKEMDGSVITQLVNGVPEDVR